MVQYHSSTFFLYTKRILDDYQKIAKADRIRNASDYDDFYIVNKAETKELIKFALEFIERTEKYIKEGFI